MSMCARKLSICVTRHSILVIMRERIFDVPKVTLPKLEMACSSPSAKAG